MEVSPSHGFLAPGQLVMPFECAIKLRDYGNRAAHIFFIIDDLLPLL
jgi:hypothetical protein